VLERIDRDLTLLSELGLTLAYVLDTHVHADHITAAYELRKKTGAKTAVSRAARVIGVDQSLEHGDTISIGSIQITAVSTPGHTAGCMSFLMADRVFTGDSLLIRSTGRTDFQDGSAPKLYQSITQTLYRLPDSTLVFPAHDYRGLPFSTIGLEKQFNTRLPAGKSEADFVRTMSELNLPPPKRLGDAVPANLKGGRREAA
jgi:glyoxylase-like metal-dependent hydrolase (beta-lactamase superfamily II)